MNEALKACDDLAACVESTFLRNKVQAVRDAILRMSRVITVTLTECDQMIAFQHTSTHQVQTEALALAAAVREHYGEGAKWIAKRGLHELVSGELYGRVRQDGEWRTPLLEAKFS